MSGSRAASTRYHLATYQRANNKLNPRKAGGMDCPCLDMVAFGLNNSLQNCCIGYKLELTSGYLRAE